MAPSSLDLHRIRPVGLAAVAVFSILLLVGCGTSTTPRVGSEPSSAAPSNSSTVTMPVDVSAVAAELLKEGFDTDFGMKMSMTLLGQKVRTSGEGRMTAGDMELQLALLIPGAGKQSRLGMVVVDDILYVRTGDGPWVKTPTGDVGSDFGLSLARLDSTAPLREGKVVTWRGREVHVLTRTITGRQAVEAMGLTDKVGSIKLEQRILAAEDGTPVQSTGTVEMTVQGQHMAMSATMTYTPADNSLPIQAPIDPWQQVKVRNGLQAAMPMSWSHDTDKDCKGCDRFFGDTTGQILLASEASYYPPEANVHAIMNAVDERGGSSTQHHTQVINGTAWEVVSMTDRRDDGSKSALTAGTAFIGGRSVLVFSWDDPVNAADARRMFKQFASTVALASG